MNNLKYLLMWVLATLLIASCTTTKRMAEAPRADRHHYHHRQRLHQRQRARYFPSLLWNKS